MQNVEERLVLDPLLKNQNWAYLWINSLKEFDQFLFMSSMYSLCRSRGLSKYIKTK